MVAVALVVGLVATLALVHVSAPASSEAIDCSVVEAASFDEAGARAAQCEVEIEVIEARTSWTTTWATPEGYNRIEHTASPSRTNVTGTWTDIDTSLTVDEETGSVVAEAPVYAIELSGGDASEEGTLGSITREGRRVELGFPVPLPEPEVVGSQALYALGDGIRLIVTVNDDGTGFFPVIELGSPDAAERFAVLLAANGAGDGFELEFPVSLPPGLRLETEGTTAKVVDEAGESHFVVPTPLMWDSAASELPNADLLEARGGSGAIGVVDDRLATPLPGDEVVPMTLRTSVDSVTVTPDRGMLADPSTVWPVYIDPAITGQPAAERVAVRTGGYTGTLYNWENVSSTMLGEGAGRCSAVSSCNTDFTQRLVWEYGGMSIIRDLDAANVISAQFKVNAVHSATCAATTMDLYTTGAISPATTWGSLAWIEHDGSRTEAHSASCGNTGWKEYDATSSLKRFARDNLTTITLGLRAADESNMNGWKRFRHDATLSVTYNRNPDKPSGMKIDTPAASCATGSSRPTINSSTPTLSALLKDPDGSNVSAKFEVVKTGGTTPTWDSGTLAAIASGQRKAVKVGTALPDGTYSWRVSASDGSLSSGWGAWCEFTVDITKPKAPLITPVTSGDGIQAVYEKNVERGGKGLKGKFTVSPNGSSDVVTFRYSFVSTTQWTTKTVTAGSSLTIEYVPSATGPVTLYAESVDRAGNVSPRAEYRFDVAAPKEDAIWKLDEGTGTTAANSGPKDVGPLTTTGATWVNGPHQLFGSRNGDKALSFAAAGQAVSKGPVVDTTKSYAVSAHVWLDPARVASGNYAGVLGQDGLQQSGFRLRYKPSCTETAGKATPGCWEFLVSGPDTLTSDAQNPSKVSAVRSSEEVRAGQWVHLVGEHDAANKKVRLWVCNAGTPDDPATGEPVKKEAARSITPLDARGAFTVGRTKHNGSSADRLQGYIDNVRVFSGQVVDESKIRRLCQGAEAEDFGGGTAGMNALDPTVSEQ